jgi:hypothetical protein
VLYTGKTFQLLGLNLHLSQEHIYILSSSVLCMGAWDALIHLVPGLIVEEYLARSPRTDFMLRLVLLLFRRYPFISFAKRTHAFLSKRSLCSFLVPQAERNWGGSMNRDLLLYVGRDV